MKRIEVGLLISPTPALIFYPVFEENARQVNIRDARQTLTSVDDDTTLTLYILGDDIPVEEARVYLDMIGRAFKAGLTAFKSVRYIQESN